MGDMAVLLPGFAIDWYQVTKQPNLNDLSHISTCLQDCRIHLGWYWNFKKSYSDSPQDLLHLHLLLPPGNKQIYRLHHSDISHTSNTLCPLHTSLMHGLLVSPRKNKTKHATWILWAYLLHPENQVKMAMVERKIGVTAVHQQWRYSSLGIYHWYSF